MNSTSAFSNLKSNLLDSVHANNQFDHLVLKGVGGNEQKEVNTAIGKVKLILEENIGNAQTLKELHKNLVNCSQLATQIFSEMKLHPIELDSIERYISLIGQHVRNEREFEKLFKKCENLENEMLFNLSPENIRNGSMSELEVTIKLETLAKYKVKLYQNWPHKVSKEKMVDDHQIIKNQLLFFREYIVALEKRNIDNENLKVVYDGLLRASVILSKSINSANPASELTLPDKLHAGTEIYSVANKAKVISILKHGINLSLGDNRKIIGGFGMGEMGNKGIYFSIERPAYIDTGSNPADPSKYVICGEVVDSMAGESIPPVGDLAHKQLYRIEGNNFTPEEIANAYDKVADENDYIRHQASNEASLSEIVIMRPDKHIKINAVKIYTGERGGNLQFKTVSVHDFLKSQGEDFEFSDQWAHTQTKVKDVDPNGRCIFIDSHRPHPMFFKPLRGAQRPEVIESEVAASKLASKIIGDLVPLTEKGSFEGVDGIIMPALEFTPLPGDPSRPPYESFDYTSLNSHQLEQLFAHSLVDWILSNHDVNAGNFGVTTHGDIVAFDKAQAYKYFNGVSVKSEQTRRNVGSEYALPANDPSFYHVEDDRLFSVHANLRHHILNGDIKINLDSPVIRDVINKIADLTVDDIKEAFEDYAKMIFPGNENKFYLSIYQRCQDIDRQVNNFRYLQREIPQAMKANNCKFEEAKPVFISQVRKLILV